jgi:signal transduction histidine kinase
MIQKFRNKTIMFLTAIFWIMLTGILLAVNISNYHTNYAETKKILGAQEVILKIQVNDEPPKDRDKNLSRIYVVTVDPENNYTAVLPEDDAEYSQEELIHMAKTFQAKGKLEGVANHFRYRISENEDGLIICFMDYGFWEHQQYQMLIYSVLIGIGGMLVFTLIAVLLAGWLTKPVVNAFNKQKQFISDAGHELKTPLTIMKASLDILAADNKDNKYFEYLEEENKRMTILVYDLLSLSNLENADERIDLEKINLSRVTEAVCLPFECVAYEAGLKFDLSVEEQLFIMGNDKQLTKMVEVMLDNAIKHTYAYGRVEVRLKKEKGRAVLQVMNEGEPIPEEERNRIFDRFYRGDKARNRNEGRFGLGLSIANTVAELHKTRINVDCREHWIIFSVNFNLI